MNKFNLLFAALLCAALVVSCGGAEMAPEAIPVEEVVVIAETPAVLEPERVITEASEPLVPVVYYRTKVLSGDLLYRYLWGVEDNTYIFSYELFNTIILEPDDILVGEITEQTRYGFLRRVTGVTSDGYSIRVETVPAVLEDVFVQAEILTDEIPLTRENIEEYWEISGLQMKAMGIPSLKSPGEFSIELKDVVIYDDDLNLNSKEDQVLVNGNVSFDPRFIFSTKIIGQQLTDVTFMLNVDEKSELTVSSKVNLLGPVQPDPAQIAWYRFKPVIIWVDFVPVIITPELSLFVGLDGKISASISTGITQEASLTSGLAYRNGPNGIWDIVTPAEGFQPGISAYQPPEFQYESELKTYSRAQIQLMIYDFIGPTAKVDAYLKLQISPEPNWWKLYDGIKVNIGIQAEVFSHVWFEYSDDVYKEEWLIDQAQYEQPEPAQPTAVPPTQTPVEEPQKGWSCWTWGFIIAGILFLLYYLGTKEK